MKDTEFKKKIAFIKKNAEEEEYDMVVETLETLVKEIKPDSIKYDRSLRSIKNDIANCIKSEYINHSITIFLQEIESNIILLNKHRTDLCFKIFLHLTIPLLPFILKYTSGTHILLEEWMLGIAVYCSSTVLFFHSRELATVGILISVFTCYSAGSISTPESLTKNLVAVGVITLSYVAELVWRHIHKYEKNKT